MGRDKKRMKRRGWRSGSPGGDPDLPTSYLTRTSFIKRPETFQS